MTSPEIRRPSTRELVAMVATFMALNALGIDIMLPALPDIARDFGVTVKANEQLVLLVYVLAFGVAQIFYGPLSDAFGRRPVIVWSMVAYLVATAACLFAPDFKFFLAARAAQGASAAAARVIAVAVVRDLMAGREMARVMSLAMVVFMVVPIAAPGVGQLVLLAGPWRWIFGFLFAGGGIVMAWTLLRLPETRPRELRNPFSLMGSLRSYGAILSDRVAVGYTVAATVAFGAMFGFLATAQPVFVDVFDLGHLFPLAFAAVATAMSFSSFVNSRLVTRFGMRRLSHGALIGFTLISAFHALLMIATGDEALWRYMALVAPAMLMFGMIGANFSAIMMEPLGARAGAGAAFFGFATTTGSALVGGVIGRAYDGTAVPLIAGQACVGALALLVVFVTERGRLFGAAPRHGP
jgi:MFS transporter, DHA1 family, multidrug resistance protein